MTRRDFAIGTSQAALFFGGCALSWATTSTVSIIGGVIAAAGLFWWVFSSNTIVASALRDALGWTVAGLLMLLSFSCMG